MARVVGIMLAAGRSRRLGRPKQLLPFGGTTLLQSTVAGASEAPLDGLVVVLGPDMEEMERRLTAMGVRAVQTPPFAPACSLSIKTGLAAASSPGAVVLLLGDQPGVGAKEVAAVVEAWQGSGKDLVVGEYQGRWGHPFLISGRYLEELPRLDGEKGVWRILQANAAEVQAVPFGRPVPRDVDHWEDYLALLAEFGLPQPPEGGEMGRLP